MLQNALENLEESILEGKTEASDKNING